MEILTKTQELRLYGETLNALRALVEAPESKDLISDIELAHGNENFPYYTLYLTDTGLYEYNGGKRNEKVVEPSIELIKKYNLNHESLVDLLVRLKA